MYFVYNKEMLFVMLIKDKNKIQTNTQNVVRNSFQDKLILFNYLRLKP